jgi:hypothetical protein
MAIEKTATGVIFFYTLILIGIGLVSIHYRRRYEDLKEWIRLMHKEDSQ